MVRGLEGVGLCMRGAMIEVSRAVNGVMGVFALLA